jgi:uncharacterized iron-regulated protein
MLKDVLVVKRLLLSIIGVIVLAGCGVMTGSKPESALLFADHPLTEKIWDVKAQRFVDRQQLLADAQQSDYLLLGETHDNRLHHQYQAWVIDGLHAQGKSAAVAFEMITQGQIAPLAGRQPDSSEALIAELNKLKTTWRYEQFYRPVFDSVLKAGYSVHAASLDRDAIMAIARGGAAHIPAEYKPLLEQNAFSTEQEASLREEIKESHCGMLGDKMADAMVRTQRVKDAVMTDSLIKHSAVDVRVLVAGSGHGRSDRGVPLYLRSQAADARIVSIAWMEVAPDLPVVADYAERWGGAQLPFDYVWFTARVDRPDPCESFRRHMHKKQAAEPKADTAD